MPALRQPSPVRLAQWCNRASSSPAPKSFHTSPRRPRAWRRLYPIGYFHIDIAEVRTEEGKLHLLVAIDRTSKFAFAELHERVTRRVAADFLRRLIEAVPYRVHTVLTDNGTHFTDPAMHGRRQKSGT